MCTAEAQEVTIARAVSQKHAPSLISAIANETSNMFAQAEKSLESLDQELVAKWRHYLALKAKVIMGWLDVEVETFVDS